jgi:glycosyltransferase involved in cell wall biosynthesis
LRIAYFSDAGSIYDKFFLTKLSEKFDVSLLTFNRKPIATHVRTFILPQILGKLPAHDGPRIYSTMPVKTAILRTWLDRLAPDALIGCSLDYGLTSALSRFQPFISFIWGSEVMILPKYLPFRAMISYVLARANCVVLDSNIHFKSCVNLGCDPSKIIELPWVDSNELIRSTDTFDSRREEFRKSLNWSTDDVVTICTRAHMPIYDVQCVLRAIPAALEVCKNARFLFVGTGPLTANLKGLAERLDIRENVHFTGYLEHKALLTCLKNSDIYVSSSLSDGTSASLIEAMASKLPCVVSDIPGNREWIVNGENGLVFPTRDYNRLAELLIDLIQDGQLRVRLGDAGFKTCVTRGNWEGNSAKLYSAIQDLGSNAYSTSPA